MPGLARTPRGDRRRRLRRAFGRQGAARQPFDITLIDRNNHHLFQPLLYQVATAALSPADIASPIRQHSARPEECQSCWRRSGCRSRAQGGRRPRAGVSPTTSGARDRRAARLFRPRRLGGVRAGTEDDRRRDLLRRRILLAFERAENEIDAAERARLLTFVVIGGGPTGVEMAGAIAELAKRALAADFRAIDPRCARIILVEAGPRVLTPFRELSEKARLRWSSSASRSAQRDGDRLQRRRRSPRRRSSRHAHHVGGRRDGVAGGRWLGAETDRAGRVKVAPICRCPGIRTCS